MTVDGEHYAIEKDIARNIAHLQEMFCCPENRDPVFREFLAGDVKMCCFYIDGMADEQMIDDFVLRAMFRAKGSATDPEQIKGRMLDIGQAECEHLLDKIASSVVNGMACLIIDGAEEALILETRGFPKRGVDQPVNESVVIGSHEGFTENLRTNISLVRRYVQTPALVTERFFVGTEIPLAVAVLYVKGVTDPSAVEEVKRRILSASAQHVAGIGGLMQWIEDAPMALLPQMLETERPDRAAAALAEGQFLVLADASPTALAAPVTVFHLLHASDDSFMRWQYGSFLRLIRIAGALLSLLLPGLYVALTLHHTQLLPMALITSIAEARANVPFTVLTEVLVMEFSFYLINEAGTRIPAKIGSALGIVGALILGQAAVDASIISPILIIIIAITGLGSYAIPNYGFSLGVVMYRMAIILSGALLGLAGICMALFAISARLCALTSFGVGYFSPITPPRPHNPDILLRLPSWMQGKRMFFANKRTGGDAV